MYKLLLIAIVGFIAQLIDGSLGMAHGVTSSTILLAIGISPVLMSTSIHLAEVVTTAVSGVSHIKLGNVDKQAVLKLIIPGSIGAFTGAIFLSNLPTDLAKPYVSLLLFSLGLYILVKFTFIKRNISEENNLSLSSKKAIPLGLIGGFLDATGGGGWGPVTTPVLLSKGGVKTRKVIGTVNTSEFAIALSATIGFFISFGWERVDWALIGALMIGGVFAAPLAAWIVKKVSSHFLGVVVGGIIILTNIQTVLNNWFVSDVWQIVLYTIIGLSWLTAFFYMIIRTKKTTITS